MKKIVATVILFTFLTSIQCAFAQPKQWAPVGATWHYSSYDTTGEWDVHRKIQVTGDTVILGKVCRKIEGLAPFLPNSTGLPQQYTYTYDSSKVIYLYDFNTNEFTQLFNQNLIQGDTFFYKWNSDVDTLVLKNKFTISTYRADTFIVDSLIHFQFDTVKYKQTYFIENIGFYNSFVLYDKAFDYSNTSIDTNLKRIRCYQDTSVFFKIVNFNWDCEYKNLWKTSIDELKEKEIYAYPNPARGTFELADGIDLLNLTDATGRTIPYLKQGNSITLSAPYQGLAILHVQHSQIKSFKTFKLIFL